MVLLGDHCDVVLWIHCLESELKCCYFAQLWTNLWCFCTVLMIMVMYQCFLSGAGVFAIMSAVTVTSSCSRMIFCGKKSFVQLIFPKCHRGKCYLRVCVCCLWRCTTAAFTLSYMLIKGQYSNCLWWPCWNKSRLIRDLVFLAVFLFISFFNDVCMCMCIPVYIHTCLLSLFVQTLQFLAGVIGQPLIHADPPLILDLQGTLETWLCNRKKSMTNMLTGMCRDVIMGCHETETHESLLVAMKLEFR